MIKSSDVFKTARGLPLNYIARPHADERLLEVLYQDCHIVIHGSSKQGKTSLRKQNLQESDYIDIMCSNNWSLREIHEQILKKAGYEISVGKTLTVKGTAKVNLKANIPLIISSGIDATGEVGKQINRKNLELDLDDVNDVINALKELNFNKYIVVEDFHYLPENTQVDFSIALKAFHELSSICFIIVGVWLEDDRLIVHNGDLSGRVKSINADLWTDEDFDKLLTKSEEYLNIIFHENFRIAIKESCNGSVFLVQQLCLQLCTKNDIMVTSPIKVTIGKDFNVTEEIKNILSDQNARYIKFMTEFSVGFSQTGFDLYKWILYVLIYAEKTNLEQGLPAAAMRRMIETEHPKRKDLTQAKLIRALSKAVDLQLKINIRPIIFEYDSSKQNIKIVDRSFLLWREYQEKSDLIDYADLSDDLNKEAP